MAVPPNTPDRCVFVPHAAELVSQASLIKRQAIYACNDIGTAGAKNNRSAPEATSVCAGAELSLLIMSASIIESIMPLLCICRSFWWCMGLLVGPP